MTKNIKIVPAGQAASSEEDATFEVTIGIKGKEKTFNAQTFLPGIFLLELIAAQSSANSDEETGVGMVTIVNEFFPAVFVGDNYTEFRSYISDPNNRIDFEDLLDIFSQLLEAYTGERPTNG